MGFDINEATVPDFDDMMNVAESIKKMAIEKSKLELKIEDTVAKAVHTVTTDSDFFVNGKPPSMAFIKTTYEFGGIHGELYYLRLQLGEVSAELDFLKNKLEVYRQMIEVWRTISANKRASVI